MSVKERRRCAWFIQVKGGGVSLAEAARQVGLSYRQALRLWKRYKRDGDQGLIHQLRGRPGNRQADSSIRRRAVALYRQHYVDFGATLACEYLLQEHKLKVDDQTLRRWLSAHGLWRRRRRPRRQRLRRERRPSFGELVQMDGSHHAWFEDRADRCVLMVMIDDATGWTLAQFFEQETTAAAMTMVRQWASMHGLPRALYPDQDSIYRVHTKQAEEVYARTGKRPLTQFGRAMAELGVRITCAHSPQAKGRVERMNGTLQDRLVKALRLAKIQDIPLANAYLRDRFLPQFNGRFAIGPASPVDAHVQVGEAELAGALCFKEQRTVGKDQCVSYGRQVLQLFPAPPAGSLADKRVTIVQSLEGTLQVLWHGKLVEHTVVARRPRSAVDKPTLRERLAKHRPVWKPPAEHPWKRPAAGDPAGDSRLQPCSAAVCSPTARRPALRKSATAKGDM